MATRTISNTGGNYNATASWVEGIVPTSADDVVATATSGQLTINVTSAASTFNFTNYTNTLTLNNSTTWTVSGTGTQTFVSAMTINNIGTGQLTLNGNGASIRTNGKLIPTLLISSSKTLLDTLNVVNINYGGATNTISGSYEVNISGNLTTGGNLISTTATQSMVGTGNITMSGGAMLCPFVINSSGTVTIGVNGLVFGASTIAGDFSIKYTSGTVSGTKLLRLNPLQTSSTQVITLDTNILQWDVVSYIDVMVSASTNTINLSSDLRFARMSISTNHQNTNINTSSILFTGSGRLIGGILLNTSQVSYLAIAGFFVEYSTSILKFTPGPTHSLTDLQWSGLPTWQSIIRSSVTGSAASLDITSAAIPSIYTNFTDITNSGVTYYCIKGTASGCVNITSNQSIQNLVTGGSASTGGSWTFIN